MFAVVCVLLEVSSFLCWMIAFLSSWNVGARQIGQGTREQFISVLLKSHDWLTSRTEEQIDKEIRYYD